MVMHPSLSSVDYFRVSNPNFGGMLAKHKQLPGYAIVIHVLSSPPLVRLSPSVGVVNIYP